MTGLRLTNIGKSFGTTPVLSNIDLDVAPAEFVAVLGPSGCGKTTLLRLLAGFEMPDAGEIHLGGRRVAGGGVSVPPEDRGIGIVFQNYALWPHMTVAENVGYALKLARLPRAERDARVARALATVNLTPHAGRRPADLSGGQRQRVALARCLAARSDIVLLDEPLANLDVHLRAAMEEEFRRFHRESGATLVYITHDQSEAMALADRVAVMDRGRLLQCAPPRQLYREPASAEVAGFIGDGQLLPVENLRPTLPGLAEAELLGTRLRLRCAAGERGRALALACLHPGDAHFTAPGAGLAVRVAGRTYRGGSWSMELRPLADLGLTLGLTLPDTGAPIPAIGEVAHIGFHDLWAIPAQDGADALPSFPALKEKLQCA